MSGHLYDQEHGKETNKRLTIFDLEKYWFHGDHILAYKVLHGHLDLALTEFIDASVKRDLLGCETMTNRSMNSWMNTFTLKEGAEQEFDVKPFCSKLNYVGKSISLR